MHALCTQQASRNKSIAAGLKPVINDMSADNLRALMSAPLECLKNQQRMKVSSQVPCQGTAGARHPPSHCL